MARQGVFSGLSVLQNLWRGMTTEWSNRKFQSVLSSEEIFENPFQQIRLYDQLNQTGFESMALGQKLPLTGVRYNSPKQSLNRSERARLHFANLMQQLLAQSEQIERSKGKLSNKLEQLADAMEPITTYLALAEMNPDMCKSLSKVYRVLDKMGQFTAALIKKFSQFESSQGDIRSNLIDLLLEAAMAMMDEDMTTPSDLTTPVLPFIPQESAEIAVNPYSLQTGLLIEKQPDISLNLVGEDQEKLIDPRASRTLDPNDTATEDKGVKLIKKLLSRYMKLVMLRDTLLQRLEDQQDISVLSAMKPDQVPESLMLTKMVQLIDQILDKGLDVLGEMSDAIESLSIPSTESGKPPDFSLNHLESFEGQVSGFDKKGKILGKAIDKTINQDTEALDTSETNDSSAAEGIDDWPSFLKKALLRQKTQLTSAHDWFVMDDAERRPR